MGSRTAGALSEVSVGAVAGGAERAETEIDARVEVTFCPDYPSQMPWSGNQSGRTQEYAIAST